MKMEKMQEIFENVLIENISNCCGANIQEVFEYLASLGFTEKEALDFVDRNYLDGINWMDEDEEESEPSKSVPVPDYFRFIEMLDKVGAQYKKLDKYKIELYQDAYTSVEFWFNTNFELESVEW